MNEVGVPESILTWTAHTEERKKNWDGVVNMSLTDGSVCVCLNELLPGVSQHDIHLCYNATLNLWCAVTRCVSSWEAKVSIVSH